MTGKPFVKWVLVSVSYLLIFSYFRKHGLYWAISLLCTVLLGILAIRLLGRRTSGTLVLGFDFSPVLFIVKSRGLVYEVRVAPFFFWIDASPGTTVLASAKMNLAIYAGVLICTLTALTFVYRFIGHPSMQRDAHPRFEVVNVMSGSAAFDAGIRRGDVVSFMGEFSSELHRLSTQSEIGVIRIRLDGTSDYLRLKRTQSASNVQGRYGLSLTPQVNYLPIFEVAEVACNPFYRNCQFSPGQFVAIHDDRGNIVVPSKALPDGVLTVSRARLLAFNHFEIENSTTLHMSSLELRSKVALVSVPVVMVTSWKNAILLSVSSLLACVPAYRGATFDATINTWRFEASQPAARVIKALVNRVSMISTLCAYCWALTIVWYFISRTEEAVLYGLISGALTILGFVLLSIVAPALADVLFIQFGAALPSTLSQYVWAI